jgi:hypothetical protein
MPPPFLSLAVCFAFAVVPLFAPCSALYASDKNAGTSGAQFLKIGGGARSAGMGEAFTAVADDVDAVVWNPAGLGRLSSAEFTASHSQWLQSADYDFLAGAYPAPWGTLGLGFATLSFDGIEKRGADTDTADGTFGARDAAYSLSYGKTFGEDWSLGVTARYIQQKIDSESASAFAGDAGLLWRTPHRPLSLGFTVKNLGSEVKFVDEGDPLPLTLALGGAYRMMEDRLTLGLDLRQPNDAGLQYGAGVELAQPLPWEMKGALRAGHSSAGDDITDGLTGLSVGAGLTWREWGFDMAWVPYGLLGSTFRYSLLVKF